MTGAFVVMGVIQLLVGFYFGTWTAHRTCRRRHGTIWRIRAHVCPACREGNHGFCNLDPWATDGDCTCQAPDHCLHIGHGWDPEADDWRCDGCGWLKADRECYGVK